MVITCQHIFIFHSPVTTNKETYDTLVFAAGRPNSNFLFFRRGFLLPPVARRLCQWSRDIPLKQMQCITVLLHWFIKEEITVSLTELLATFRIL
jgi:hypothetical protein